MAKDKREKARAQFWEDVLKHNQEGRMLLVAEPKLDGAAEWDGAIDSNSAAIAIYATNEDAKRWLHTRREFLRSKPYDFGEGDEARTKYYYNREETGAIPDAVFAEARTREPFGAQWPLAVLDDIPRETRLAVASIDEAPGAVLLISARPQADVESKLRKQGLLKRKAPMMLDYDAINRRGERQTVIAVALPSVLAQSIAACTSNKVENWSEREPQSIAAWLEDAMQDLALPDPVIATSAAEEKPKDAPAPSPAPLPLLDSRGRAIRAAHPRLVKQPLPNGDEIVRVMIDDPSLLTGVRDPIGLMEWKKVNGQTIYSISRENLVRLEDIAGPMQEAMTLPLNTAPLNEIFQERTTRVGASSVNRTHTSIKRRKREVPNAIARSASSRGITHAIFARDIRGESVVYACYLVGEKPSSLDHVEDRLMLSTNAVRYLTASEQRPTMIRYVLPKATWDALHKKAEDVVKEAKDRQKEIDFSLIDLEDGSLQLADQVALEKAGIVPVETERAPEKVKAPKPEKLDGDAAEELLLKKLSAFDNASLASAELLVQNESQEPFRRPVVFVRAEVGALNSLRNALIDDTSMFRERQVRFIDNRRTGIGMGTLSIQVSDKILAAMAAREVERVSAPEGEDTLRSDVSHKAVKDLFDKRERAVVQRDAITEGIRHLRSVAILQIEVGAPDMQKLAVREAEFDTLLKALTLLEAPANEMYRNHELIKGYLKEFANDKEIATSLNKALAVAREAHKAISTGPLISKVRSRLVQLRRQAERIKEEGVRLDYIVPEPDARSMKLLGELGPEYIEPGSLYMDASGALCLTPTGKCMKMMKERGGHSIAWVKRDAPVPLDELPKAVREERNKFMQRKGVEPQEEEKEKESEISEHVLALRGQKPTHHALKRALEQVSGLLAKERQEPPYANHLTKEKIGTQYVLMLDGEADAIERVRGALERAGCLHPAPRFYDKLVPADASIAVEEVRTEADGWREEHEQWSSLIGALENVLFAFNRTDEFIKSTRAHGLDILCEVWQGTPALNAVSLDQMRKHKGDGLRVPTLTDMQQWRDALAAGESVDEDKVKASVEQVRARVRGEMDKIMDKLHDAKEPLHKAYVAPKPAADVMIDVVAGGPVCYDVEENPQPRMASWGMRVSQSSASVKKKIYLNDAGVEQVRAMLGELRGKPIQDIAQTLLTPDVLANRLAQLCDGSTLVVGK